MLVITIVIALSTLASLAFAVTATVWHRREQRQMVALLTRLADDEKRIADDEVRLTADEALMHIKWALEKTEAAQ